MYIETSTYTVSKNGLLPKRLGEARRWNSAFVVSSEQFADI